ncbi:MAG TPA: conjugal transfer protein TraF [Gallionellaceae bacterium]|nr:conjugal transfer protein TraF [Gallionellaceae bacterium]
MSFKPHKLAATAALLMSSSVALAIPFGSFDSRSMAMGGAGVAVGGADAAPLFNPALLSVAQDKDDFALILPTIGVRIADPDKLLDSIDQFQKNDYIGQLNTAITNLNAAATPAAATIAAQQVSTAITNVSNQLTTLSNKPIAVDGGVATVVGLPSKKFGVAFYANAAVATGGLFKYNDATQLGTLANNSQLCATDPTVNANACTAVKNFQTTSLTSGINFKGVALGEFGFSLSREFNIAEHGVAFGITPKIVKAQLFDAQLKVNSSNQSNVTGADYLAEYSFVNFDLGVAKNYSNGWRTGFVVKNVIPQTLDFKKAPTPGATPVATGEQLSLKPQARIGVSHANSWSTVALDVDMTRNDPAGFENSTQYVALGGELNAWDWAQLRAGYRVDMVNSERNVTSVGLGFSPFGVVHADLAVAGNATEIGASFQLGVHF